jgi:hypothetical protein
MGVALHIAAGPIGFIAAALAAIGVALGVVVMKSKLAAAGGSAAAENRYREAARMMVAENEATRIQQERNNVKQPFTSPRAADSVQQRNDTRQSFTSPKAAAFAKTTAGMARREAARQAGVLDETARENLSKAQLIAVSGLRSDPYTVAISSSMNKQADAAFAARQEEIEKLKNKPRRYQIHSSLVNEFGPLSLDEALQVQARKWSNEDRFNRTTLRGSELTNYVAANPDEITYQEALRRLREDAANESAEDNGMDPEMRKYLDDFEEWFKKLNDGLNKETEKIPGRIQYSAMGKEDFWELARAGL